MNTPKQLRPRINDYNYNDLDSTAAEEENLNEDTNSENDITKPHNSTLASEETEASNINVTPPPSFTYSPIVNPIIDHVTKVLTESRKASAKRCLDESDPTVQTSSKKGNKKVKCNTCDKSFIRISAHKCKQKQTNSLI